MACPHEEEGIPYDGAALEGEEDTVRIQGTHDVDGEEEYASLGVNGPMGKEEFDTLALPERYIISKCHELVESVTSDIEQYQLGAAGSKVSEK